MDISWHPTIPKKRDRQASTASAPPPTGIPFRAHVLRDGVETADPQGRFADGGWMPLRHYVVQAGYKCPYGVQVPLRGKGAASACIRSAERRGTIIFLPLMRRFRGTIIEKRAHLGKKEAFVFEERLGFGSMER